MINKVKHRGRNQKGWKLHDPLFNVTICCDLGIDADTIDNDDISEFDISSSWFCFSDGSCIDEEGGSKSKYAGWGFAIYGMANASGVGTPIIEAAGPVVLVRCSKYYVGATRYTSNTGELTAVVECLLWWASIAEKLKNGNNEELLENMKEIKLGDGIVLTVDSMYVVRLLKGQCKAIENQLLVNLMIHLWRFVGASFTIKVRWSPGHNNDKKGFKQLPGTGLVDDLAGNVGTNKGKQDSWWKRPYLLCDWGERAFVCKLHGENAAKRQKTGINVLTTCDEAPPQDVMRIIDADALPALHSNTRQSVDGHLVSTVSELTQSIADAASKCGNPPPEVYQETPKH